MLSASDRSVRLRSACDPDTPVDLLFELAMEFPDQVAANPVLALALASRPDCISSATDVALACILSSPALPDAVGGVLESLVHDRAAASADSPAASAAEYLRAWRDSGALRVLVDVSAPCRAAEGLHSGFERATRGRVILAARLGVRSFQSYGPELSERDPEYFETDFFQAGGGTRNSGGLWPRVLLPEPPNCGRYSLFSSHCRWDRLRGEAVVELALCRGEASALFLVPVDGAVDSTVTFERLKFNNAWDHPLTEGGLGALRRMADSLRQSSVGLEEEDIAIGVCNWTHSEGYRDPVIATLNRTALKAYFSEHDLLGEPWDADEEESDEGDSERAVRESGLFALLRLVLPNNFAEVVDYAKFEEAVRPSAFVSECWRAFEPTALVALFESVIPPGRLDWSGGELHSSPGTTDDRPGSFVSLADASGAVAFFMLDFQYADGWREWRVSTDPLVDVST